MINFTKEDLNALFPPAVEEHMMQVLEVLNQAHAAGARRIDIEVRGAGDSGCCEGIYFSKKDYEELKLDTNLDIVKEWSWGLAYNTCPGFEINDGGGMDINISITDDDSVEVNLHMYTLETTTEHFYNSFYA